MGDTATRDLIAVVVAEEPGWQLLAAHDGAHALAAFATVRPNVVLLDLRLPSVGGAGVCRRLKADPSTAAIPVIGFSASASEAAARAAGCDDFVAKPFELDHLVARMRRWLRLDPPRGQASVG